MKKVIILALVFSIYSCADSDKSVETVIERGDLSEIRAKKAALSAEQSELKAQLAELDKALDELVPGRDLALVSTLVIRDSLFNHFVELPGDVATDENVIIYPEYSGIMREVLVDEGDEVREGQVLARIDAGGLESQLAQIQAQATLAETTFQRQKRLWDQKIGSEIQFLEAQTNFEALQSSVNQLKSQLEKTIVRAPFSGVIDEVFSEEGEVVAPGGSRLFRLIDLSDMYITTAVPEAYLGKIEKGTDVMVEIGTTGYEFESEVVQVGNFINPNNRTFEIKVAVPKNVSQLRPNLIATVKLNDYKAENAVVIPENVIQTNAEGQSLAYTFLPESDSVGIVEQRIIITGYSYEGEIEVLEGIEEGDTLVLAGVRGIQEGQKVKIRN